jgi:hypothetical protein
MKFLSTTKEKVKKLMKEKGITKSDQELIERFNGDVRNPGWVSARARFLTASREELLSRNFDCSEIITAGGMLMGHKIKLENNKLIKID